MNESFAIDAPMLDVTSLAAEVERSVRPGVDAPPERQPAPPSMEAAKLSPVETLLASLLEDADAAQGFPPQSHRRLGGAVVAAKKGFRMALQPFINETFARQKVFNRRLLDTIAALHAENRALESRIERLEALLARESTEN
jgi:hypothetical protein